MSLSLFSATKKQEFRWLPANCIAKNPAQPRRIFDEQALAELADSIRRYGIITPLTVRRVNGGYQLVAGERRLRAAVMAGLEALPCYVVAAEEEDSSLMALVENLQRRDLDFFEEALGLQRLTELYGLTQQQAAEKLGKTQSAVANKLRLLKLSPETIALVREYGLTERHARALLRLADPALQTQTAAEIVRRGYNVEQTEAYIERLLEAKPAPSAGRRKGFIRDVRLFLNTVNRAVAAMQSAGVGAQVDQQECPEELILTIRIPRAVRPV